MAPWVKCLPEKHEAWGQVSRIHKNLYETLQVCNPRAPSTRQAVVTKQFPGAQETASLSGATAKRRQSQQGQRWGPQQSSGCFWPNALDSLWFLLSYFLAVWYGGRDFLLTLRKNKHPNGAKSSNEADKVRDQACILVVLAVHRAQDLSGAVS